MGGRSLLSADAPSVAGLRDTAPIYPGCVSTWVTFVHTGGGWAHRENPANVAVRRMIVGRNAIHRRNRVR